MDNKFSELDKIAQGNIFFDSFERNFSLIKKKLEIEKIENFKKNNSTTKIYIKRIQYNYFDIEWPLTEREMGMMLIKVAKGEGLKRKNKHK